MPRRSPRPKAYKERRLERQYARRKKLREARDEEKSRLSDFMASIQGEADDMYDAIMTLGYGLQEDLRVASVRCDVRKMVECMVYLNRCDFETPGWSHIHPLSDELLKLVERDMPPETRLERRHYRDHAVLLSFGYVCPRCSKRQPMRRRWHLSSSTDRCMCRKCWSRFTGRRLGRVRTGEPPVDGICPACGKKRKRRRQWDLKNGICKTCSKRAATSSS